MSEIIYKAIIEQHLDVEKLLFEDTGSHLRNILEYCFAREYAQHAQEKFFRALFFVLHPGFLYPKIPKGIKKVFYQHLLYQIFSCSFPIEHLRTKERLTAYLIQVVASVSTRGVLSKCFWSDVLYVTSFCMKFYNEGSFFLLEEARKIADFAHIIDHFYRGLIDVDAFWDFFSDKSRCTKDRLIFFCQKQKQEIEKKRKQIERLVQKKVSKEFIEVFGMYGHQAEKELSSELSSGLDEKMQGFVKQGFLQHLGAYTNNRHRYVEGAKWLRLVLPTYNKSLQHLPYLISQSRAIVLFCRSLSLRATDIPLYIFDQSDEVIFNKNRRYKKKIEAAFGVKIIHVGKKALIKRAKKIGALDLIVTKSPDIFGYAGARNAVFLLTEKTAETAIQMGDDDLYVGVQSIFSDALTASMYKDEDFFKTGYLFGRKTLQVYATIDLELLLQSPEHFVAQVTFSDEPVLHPMAGALLKPKLCINMPFGQEENHVWAKRVISTDFRRPSIHLSGPRYPKELEPKNRYSGLRTFLPKLTQYVYELLAIEELLDTMDRRQKTACVWNRNIETFYSFQSMLYQIIDAKNECQNVFYNNFKDEAKRLFHTPQGSNMHAADCFRALLALNIPKKITEFIQSLPHAAFFKNELKDIEALFLFFQKEASYYKAYVNELLHHPHDVMRAKEVVEALSLKPIEAHLFTFVLHELHVKIGEGAFFEAIEKYAHTS